ncbi:MAG: TetR/AcrR family transcriptional regulator [Cyclobacteriaceae bacterium]|nr:TetR/AcrR family transcriptional regulator [Cytophagales bacterium]MBX2898477.1 TetR/AcrR family transcriptional regulator [Cyclobacteriaceae bacterium]
MDDLFTYEKILEGAEALFMKYGVRSVTMDDIARHLAVSKKTLYQHFADKDDLVFKMSEKFLERAFSQYDTIARTSRNSIEELSKVSVCMKLDMENINPSVLFDLQKYHPKAWNLWTEHKGKIISESVLRNIRKGIEDGYFRPEVNPEIMALIRIALIESAFNGEVFPRERFSLADVQSQLFDLFVHGLCTEKGKRLYQKYKETQLTNQPNEAIL